MNACSSGIGSGLYRGGAALPSSTSTMFLVFTCQDLFEKRAVDSITAAAEAGVITQEEFEAAFTDALTIDQIPYWIDNGRLIVGT